jgi:hypothetical protein
LHVIAFRPLLEEHSDGSPCIYTNISGIYVYRTYSRDLTHNFFVVGVIEANLFNNPDEGDIISNEILVPTWLEEGLVAQSV